MNNAVRIRPATDSDLDAVSQLAIRVFKEFVAPFYAQEGRDEFHRYAQAEMILERHGREHRTLIAELEGHLIGMAHLRHSNHLAMLFIASGYQRSGVGRRLLDAAVDMALRHDSSTTRITVNSSPNAVEAYRRLGFCPTGPEQTERGIRFLPMALELGSPGRS